MNTDQYEILVAAAKKKDTNAFSKILKVNANTVRSKISRGLKKMEPLLK